MWSLSTNSGHTFNNSTVLPVPFPLHVENIHEGNYFSLFRAALINILYEQWVKLLCVMWNGLLTLTNLQRIIRNFTVPLNSTQLLLVDCFGFAAATLPFWFSLSALIKPSIWLDCVQSMCNTVAKLLQAGNGS